MRLSVLLPFIFLVYICVLFCHPPPPPPPPLPLPLRRMWWMMACFYDGIIFFFFSVALSEHVHFTKANKSPLFSTKKERKLLYFIGNAVNTYTETPFKHQSRWMKCKCNSHLVKEQAKERKVCHLAKIFLFFFCRKCALQSGQIIISSRWLYTRIDPFSHSTAKHTHTYIPCHMHASKAKVARLVNDFQHRQRRYFAKWSRISVAIYTIFHFSNIYVVYWIELEIVQYEKSPVISALYWFWFCIFCLSLTISFSPSLSLFHAFHFYPVTCYSQNIHTSPDIKFQRSINFIRELNGNELFNGFLIGNWADAFERAKYPNIYRWSMIKCDYGCWKFSVIHAHWKATAKMIFDEESSSSSLMLLKLSSLLLSSLLFS